MSLSEGEVRGLVEGTTEGPWKYTAGFLKHYVSSPDYGQDLGLSLQELHWQDGREVPAAQNARLIAAAPDLARTTLSLYAENATLRTALGEAQARAEALEQGPDVDALTTECVALGNSPRERMLAISIEKLIDRAYQKRQLNKSIADWQAIVNQDRRKVAAALAGAGAEGEGTK